MSVSSWGRVGAIAADVESAVHLSTAEIPEFPPSTVSGHAGELILERLAVCRSSVLSVGLHSYEGYDPPLLGLPVRVLHALGARILITTNAAGALNQVFSPGDVMLIEDHVSSRSLAGRSPPGCRRARAEPAALRGFDRRLHAVAAKNGAGGGSGRGYRATPRSVRHGGGPNFETPAEVRFLRLIGGDAVGMSTVPEVIVARQMDMGVVGLSVVSNLAAGMPGALLDHDDVMASMGRAAPLVGRIIRGLLARLPA